MTAEQAFQLGQLGTNQLCLQLDAPRLFEEAVAPFVEKAAVLGLTPRSPPEKEQQRIFFEILCLGLAVIGVESRKHVLTDSVFSPKLDPEKHRRFLDGLYQDATHLLDQHEISSLRERLPHGNRNGDALEYRDGKPLSGSHLRSRVEEYMKRILTKAERGEEDYSLATWNDFVFHLTELIDARLTNRNDEVQEPIQAISATITKVAMDVVDVGLFGEE